MEIEGQQMKKDDVVGEEDVDIGEEIPVNNFPPVEIERDAVGAGNESSGSSSSSSGSDSSSSSGMNSMQNNFSRDYYVIDVSLFGVLHVLYLILQIQIPRVLPAVILMRIVYNHLLL